MANILGAVATGLAVLAVTLNFSLHKIEEGHVGVYFRVSSGMNYSILLFTSNSTNMSILTYGRYSIHISHLFIYFWWFTCVMLEVPIVQMLNACAYFSVN